MLNNRRVAAKTVGYRVRVIATDENTEKIRARCAVVPEWTRRKNHKQSRVKLSPSFSGTKSAERVAAGAGERERASNLRPGERSNKSSGRGPIAGSENGTGLGGAAVAILYSFRCYAGIPVRHWSGERPRTAPRRSYVSRAM